MFRGMQEIISIMPHSIQVSRHGIVITGPTRQNSYQNILWIQIFYPNNMQANNGMTGDLGLTGFKKIWNLHVRHTTCYLIWPWISIAFNINTPHCMHGPYPCSAVTRVYLICELTYVSTELKVSCVNTFFRVGSPMNGPFRSSCGNVQR